MKPTIDIEIKGKNSYGPDAHVMVFPQGSGWTLQWNDFVINEWEEHHHTLSAALARVALLAACAEADWKPGFADDTKDHATHWREFLAESLTN